MSRQRVFIVDYQHGSEAGTKVIRASGTRSIKDRLWMCQWARITEVQAVNAWVWRRGKMEKARADSSLIIGDQTIVRRSVEHQRRAANPHKLYADQPHTQLPAPDTALKREVES